MSNSIEGTVNVALALQNQNVMQQKDNLLLHKALGNRANTIAALVNSVPTAPELATSGLTGTLLHTTA